MSMPIAEIDAFRARYPALYSLLAAGFGGAENGESDAEVVAEFLDQPVKESQRAALLQETDALLGAGEDDQKAIRFLSNRYFEDIPAACAWLSKIRHLLETA